MTRKIEFIISTYKNPYHLITLLSCLVSQTSPNWTAHVVADGVYEGHDMVKNIFSSDPRIKFSVIDGPTGDWGYTPRQYARERCTEEFMVMTGDDNYYTSIFVEEFLKVIDDNTNMVYCNMVLICQKWRLATGSGYVHVLETSPVPTRIDLGCYATRTSLNKLLPISNSTPHVDGAFAQEFFHTFCQANPGQAKKIDKVLYVHN